MIRTESAHICQISDFGVGDQARIDPPFGPCLLFWESLTHTDCRFRKPLVDFSRILFLIINWTRYLQIPQVDPRRYFQYLVRYRVHSWFSSPKNRYFGGIWGKLCFFWGFYRITKSKSTCDCSTHSHSPKPNWKVCQKFCFAPPNRKNVFWDRFIKGFGGIPLWFSAGFQCWKNGVGWAFWQKGSGLLLGNLRIIGIH